MNCDFPTNPTPGTLATLTCSRCGISIQTTARRRVQPCGGPIGPAIDAPRPSRWRRLAPGNLFALVARPLIGRRACGGCDHRRTQLNAWGWRGLWPHRREIGGWIRVGLEKHPPQTWPSKTAARILSVAAAVWQRLPSVRKKCPTRIGSKRHGNYLALRRELGLD